MHIFEIALGLGEKPEDLGMVEMALRAVVIYLVTLVIVRLGKKRFMSRASAFDVIVGIMLGSIASRAITGNAPMAPAMAAATMTMALHWAFSALAVRWHAFGTLIKGHDRILVRDGRVDEDELRTAHMTMRDLAEELREKGIADVAGVAEARLERDGAISAVKKPDKAKVVTIDVAPGVQTVRLEFG
ncbi:DUF421 domain-containing protein [Sphingosinicella sp. BN140058]|uniref:DUF421 domain-containing protein n=1 Tax=Sphingosinicella sp. BN140058 TaxID=1892855 RepID=UPI0010122DEA|nr:YetF domain-containing protein [Sphingosinicella sp. BN140058]QAY79420.1 DUF421 domain-containing protein [Sphingosinicella sp. BN140058]